MMTKRLSVAAGIVGMALASSFTSIAQERGMWRAASKTARAITGDVVFSDERLSMNFSGYAIAQIRALTPVEIGAEFDSDSSAGGSGNLYRLSIPATKKFLHGNTMCGGEETQWLATYTVGKNLQMAFFSGALMPVFTPDALANSTNLCGTYSYVR